MLQRSITPNGTLYKFIWVNCSSCSICATSTNLCWVATFCKWFISTSSRSSLPALYIYIVLTILLRTLLCRLKIWECKIRNIHDVGFIDPHIVNGHVLQHHPEDVEKDLYKFLRKHQLKSHILFPYHFGWVFLSCAHSLLFTPCMVCLIDELCMTVHVTCPQVPLDSAKYWTSHLQSSNHGLYGFGSKALGRHEKNAAKVIIFNHLSSISIGLFRSFPNIK